MADIEFYELAGTGMPNEEYLRTIRELPKIPKEDPDCFGREEKDANWHTGTPTKNGDYLIAFHPWGRKEKGICYMGLRWEEDHWYDPVTDYFSEPYLVAWQKIEPYKEKE